MPLKGKLIMDMTELIPLAVEWAETQQEEILKSGVSLDFKLMDDARILGVKVPEKVRLLKTPQIPLPDTPFLRKVATQTNLISPNTVGLTLYYGIFIRSDYWGNRPLIVHELAHTMQYEREGGFKGFLEKYLYECTNIGYPQAPMEQEAINLSQQSNRSVDFWVKTHIKLR